MVRTPILTTLFLPGITALSLLAGLLLARGSFFLVAISIGLAQLLLVAYQDLRKNNWALDYIAFLAMVLAIFSNELLAGAVIALMYVGGRALEDYASERAQSSLASLLSRLPKTVLVRQADGSMHEEPIGEVPVGATIIVHAGELVPLDGYLASKNAVVNLANLTGEPLPEAILEGAVIKSGSINAGAAFELTVSGELATSTYAKIIDLVKDAEREQAPFVRLAEKANIPFTLITLLVAGGAYFLTGEWMRVLAVLVIATPCPLIIAAPVAFIGGLSRAAGKNIIVKTPAALESIAQVKTIFFDKTGTLTLGEPHLTQIKLLERNISELDALSYAAALEFHSIHPLARALISAVQERTLSVVPAEKVTEVVGTGIQGIVDGKNISLAQAPDEYRNESGISLLLTRDAVPAALFHFTDVLKNNAKTLLTELKNAGYKIAVLTGDSEENAETVFDGLALEIHANCTPEEKYRLVEAARARGEHVAMVGDGLNDAPALARADVGIVFSGTENSASIEAANVAILGHDLSLIQNVLNLSRRSMHIASESVYVGMGLSFIGMTVAAAGFIAPVTGAILQEGIDVTVILNALRAAFRPRI